MCEQNATNRGTTTRNPLKTGVTSGSTEGQVDFAPQVASVVLLKLLQSR